MPKSPPTRKKKQTVITPLIGYIVILLALLLIGFFVFKSQKLPVPLPQPSPTTRIFRSNEVMNFTIEVPLEFQVDEKLGSVILTGPNGEISIGRNATNFDNLTDYVKNSRNNLNNRISNIKNININGLTSLSGFLDNQKIYLIYTNHNVMHLWTNNASLYNTLDQIAQSFKYTPN